MDFEFCHYLVIGCGADTFECGDGTCIPMAYVCDNENDCDDGSDETYCGETKCCINAVVANCF